ncbi:hypothetical protein ACP70R_034764 [Stipagrostis hirtigluma subsp. patula]
MAAPAASPSREELVYTAELSEATQRYAEYVGDHEQCGKVGHGAHSARLFSRAYHNVIDEKCAAWHTLASFQLEQGKKGNWKAEKAAKEFRLKVEAEINNTCFHVIGVIDKHLLPSSFTAMENSVFYHKMKGNCYETIGELKARYLGFMKGNGHGTLAELKSRAERRETSDCSLKAYMKVSVLWDHTSPGFKHHELTLLQITGFAVVCG